MEFFQHILQMFRYRLSEKLLNGLHILSGYMKPRGEYRSESLTPPDEHDNRPPNGFRAEESAMTHMPRKRTGWQGKR